MKNFRLAAAALVLASTPAYAQDAMVIASDPQSVMDFFFEKGVPAQLTVDSVGDPLIDFRDGGDEYSLFFYDCLENEDCLALQFYSGYITEGDVTLDMLNEWNTDNRFTRTYLTTGEDVAARIEMDISTNRGGITHEDFEALYDLWMDRVLEFEDFIGW